MHSEQFLVITRASLFAKSASAVLRLRVQTCVP
jgi:hypothetical protein